MFGHLNHGKPELDGSVTITTGAGAEIVEYTAGGAITAGDVVKMDSGATRSLRSTTVVQGGADNLAIGVALETVASGEAIRVCVGGYIENVACDGGILLGALVAPIAAGEVGAVGAGFAPVGVVLENEAGGTVDLYWFRRA